MSELIAAPIAPGLDDADRARLAEAVDLLERPSFAARVGELMGRQIDVAGRVLPDSARAIVARATMLALNAALKVAVRGMAAEAVPAATRRDRVLERGMAWQQGAYAGHQRDGKAHCSPLIARSGGRRPAIDHTMSTVCRVSMTWCTR